MKITDLSTFLVEGTVGRNWLFVKTTTSNGIVGYGEATIESREKTTETAVLELKRYLIGKDPTEIERHWQAMYRGTFWRGGPVLCSAISGVEQSLWDILAKSLGCPVYKLFGGPCRDRIKVYTHVSGLTPEELAENSKKLVSKGYRALKLLTYGANSYTISSIPTNEETMKMRPLKETVARVAAVRDAVGEDIDIMLDAHGRLDPATAVTLASALERYNLLFFEEPISPDNVSTLPKVMEKTKIPIAAGERIYTKFGFSELINSRGVDIIQPDPCHAGGISECRKIASIAECKQIGVAPHNPNSPFATFVCLHLDATIPNFVIQEMIPDDMHPRKNVLSSSLEFDNGYLRLPRGPGFGAQLDEKFLTERPYKPQDLPIVYYEDGSVADW